MSLLSPDDLASLLVFESLTKDWVREVHTYSSKRKRGKTFVIFRNYRNKTISTLEELRLEFDDATFLDTIPFISGHSHDIVSNKVGAGKIARKAAKKWMEVSGKRPTENVTKNGDKYKIDLKEKASIHKVIETRQSIQLLSDKQHTSKGLEGKNKKQEESFILRDADGFKIPNKIATTPLLTESELAVKNKYHIIEQQTKDVFKPKELGSNEEESDRSKNKISPHQQKIYTTDEETDTPNNGEIRKDAIEKTLITQPEKALSDSLKCENNKNIEKTITGRDDFYVKTIENLQSKKDDHLLKSKDDEKNFQDTMSDSDFDTDSDSEGKKSRANEQALLIGEKADENVLFQTCINESAESNGSAPIFNKLIQDSNKNKLRVDPEANINLSLNESSDAWMHDYIGSLDDDESEEESIEQEFPEEINAKSKAIKEDILQKILAKKESTPVDDTGDKSVLPDIPETIEDTDINNGMKKEEDKIKNVKLCTTACAPTVDNEPISIITKSAEETNQTQLTDERKGNVHLSLSDSSDAWMHDYIGSMDDDESEEESSSEKETQSSMQSKLNEEQLKIPLNNIPFPKTGEINICQTFLPEKDDVHAVDNNDATFNNTTGENYNHEVKNEKSKPSSCIAKDKIILSNESTETKMLSLPLHESSDAWMAEDLGSMADDDDDSEDETNLDRKKTSALQMFNQTEQKYKETEEEKPSQDTGLVDVLQLFLKDSDQDMVEYASNKDAMIIGKKENEDVKDYICCLPPKDLDAKKEKKGTIIAEEKTKNEKLYHIEHTTSTGGSYDLDENKTGLINVLTTFLKESDNMAISDTVYAGNRIETEKDIQNEVEESTAIGKEDKQGLGGKENVMEKDQAIAFIKEQKNKEENTDIGKIMDSEEVIPPDKSGLVGVLKTFIAEGDSGYIPKPTDIVVKDDMPDRHDPNTDISKQTEDLQISVEEDQSDSDENSSSDNIFDYGTDDSDLGSSDSPTDTDSDCENESKEDSEPAKNGNL